jgi:hypothetical protein
MLELKVPLEKSTPVMACDKREAFAQGSKSAKQSMPQRA